MESFYLPFEQHAHQGARQIHPLIGHVIPVIFPTPLKSHFEQPLHHVPQEVGLPCVTELICAQVGQQLLLDDVLGEPHSLRLRRSRIGSSRTDKTQSDRLILDAVGFINGWPQHLDHFQVVHVVNDLLKDFLVRYEAQSPEDDEDWNLLLYVRHDGDYVVPERAFCRFLVILVEICYC